MGLDISSQSEKGYHAGYGGIHQIRYMAYKAQDGKKDYGGWHQMQQQVTDTDWPYTLCMLFYPNLYWHSDCEGTYTLRGKIDMTGGKLLTGNSKQLLWELADIKEMLEAEPKDGVTGFDWERFNMLYELVKDVVENHNGRLEFA